MKKILIVEDNPVLRKALRTQIELMGFTGITAQNGKDGIETAIAEKPDLIMTDSNMPEMDGLAATRILRATSETKDIAIIAVTAVSDIQSSNLPDAAQFRELAKHQSNHLLNALVGCTISSVQPVQHGAISVMSA